MRRVPVGGGVDLESLGDTEDRRSQTPAYGPRLLFWPRNDPDPIELADPDAVTVEDRAHPEQRLVTIGSDALPTPDSSVEARNRLGMLPSFAEYQSA
jgi:hypothetical protein